MDLRLPLLWNNCNFKVSGRLKNFPSGAVHPLTACIKALSETVDLKYKQDVTDVKRSRSRVFTEDCMTKEREKEERSW